MKAFKFSTLELKFEFFRQIGYFIASTGIFENREMI